MANLYLNKGDLQNARLYYQRALSVDPDFAIAASNLAWVYLKQGDSLDEALALARKAKQLLPELDSVSDTLAWIQYKKGSYANALPLLRECVQKVPNHAVYHYHLGMVLIASGEKEKGKEQLSSALGMNLTEEDAQEARRTLAQLN